MLGVALLVTETLGNAHLPHSEERIGELVMYTELMRACMRAAEADAEARRMGRHVPGPAAGRDDAQPVHDRLPADGGDPPAAGLVQPDDPAHRGGSQTARWPGTIDQYLATDSSSARDRVKLFHLAWDIACSSFGSRQVLYERFFASDPLTRARALASMFPKQQVTDRVLDFLGRD